MTAMGAPALVAGAIGAVSGRSGALLMVVVGALAAILGVGLIRDARRPRRRRRDDGGDGYLPLTPDGSSDHPRDYAADSRRDDANAGRVGASDGGGSGWSGGGGSGWSGGGDSGHSGGDSGGGGW